MSSAAIRRVVVACDAACDIAIAVAGAAEIAARCNAALHGVFLEDENLLRLAGLPVARQVDLSSARAENVGTDEIEKLFAILAGTMRRALSEAATTHGVLWSFATLRDMPTKAALAHEEGDILVIEGRARPVVGSWRPPSPWEDVVGALAGLVLLRRDGRDRHRRAVLLVRDEVDAPKILGAALAAVGPHDELVILADDELPAAALAALQAAAGPRKVRAELAPHDAAALRRRIAALQPALLALAPRTRRERYRDLIAATTADVMRVG